MGAVSWRAPPGGRFQQGTGRPVKSQKGEPTATCFSCLLARPETVPSREKLWCFRRFQWMIFPATARAHAKAQCWLCARPVCGILLLECFPLFISLIALFGGHLHHLCDYQWSSLLPVMNRRHRGVTNMLSVTQLGKFKLSKRWTWTRVDGLQPCALQPLSTSRNSATAVDPSLALDETASQIKPLTTCE